MKLYKFYLQDCGHENEYPYCKYAFLPISNDDERWTFKERSLTGKITLIKPEAFKADDYKSTTDVAVVMYIRSNVKSQTDDKVVICSGNIAFFTTAEDIAKAGGLDKKKCREYYLRFVNQEGPDRYEQD